MTENKNTSNTSGTNCVFCDIVNKQSKDTNIEFENENLIIIKDIKPATEHHYLAITKKHIADARNLTKDDKILVEEMQTELKRHLEILKADLNDVIYGFHWPPFISVNHLHMHGISPASRMTFIGRWIFKPYNMWFRTTAYVLSNL